MDVGKRSQLYERLQSGELDRMRQRLFSQHNDPRPEQLPGQTFGLTF